MSAASAAGAGPASRRADLLGLAGFLLACFAVAAAAGAVTADSVATWYPTLNKPAFTPPDLVFAPAWTVLYAAMAVAGWRVWRKVGFAGGRNALTLFAIQLLDVYKRQSRRSAPWRSPPKADKARTGGPQSGRSARRPPWSRQ